MKSILFTFTLILISVINSCSMIAFSKKTLERKEQDKIYRPCQDYESEKPIGKLCNRICEKRRFGKCKKWKTTIKDFSNKNDFLFFRNGTFIMIDEDFVL